MSIGLCAKPSGLKKVQDNSFFAIWENSTAGRRSAGETSVFQIRRALQANFELLLYDLTSTYFEGGAKANPMLSEVIRGITGPIASN